MTSWLDRTERFFAEGYLFAVDALTLCMEDGTPYLEADLKLTVTENSPVFLAFRAWRSGHGQSGQALLDSLAAKKNLLGWVEYHVQSSAAHTSLNLNITAKDFTVIEDAAST